MPTAVFNARDLSVQPSRPWLSGVAALLLGACTGYVSSPSGSAPSGGAGTGAPAGGVGGNSAACTSIDPGRVTVHRLNIVEYNNTVHDLLGDTTQPGNDFPDDTGGGNFDNNADVLSTSPLLFEKLETAAEGLASTALIAGSATRARIITCDPTTTGEAACASRVLTALARKAWRRPATSDELVRLTAFVPLARKNGDSFDQGIALAVKAILLSPHFMFRPELDPDPTATTPRLLNDFEMAARLSYFLWSSMPDDMLAAAADSGQLRDAASLQQQATRMLADPKAAAMVANMGGQWFGLYKMAAVSPSATQFPTFDPALATAMTQETTLFLNDFFFNSGLSFLDALDAPWTYVNARLAQHYGLTGVTGTAFQKVSLAGANRAGLLGQASILTTTSLPTRTSPVKRGYWALSNVLCTPPPPPPDNIPPLDATPVPPGSSLRTQLDAHVSNPVCATCHNLMDPIGFGLEHFDAIGAWRDRDGTAVIDATGVLPDKTAFDGAVQLASALKHEASSVTACVTQKMFAYSLGRDPVNTDRCQMDQLSTSFVNGNYSFRSFIMQMIASDAFRMRHPVAPGGV